MFTPSHWRKGGRYAVNLVPATTTAAIPATSATSATSAYRGVLAHAGRRALLEAIERLTEVALDAVVKMMNDGRAFAHTCIAGYYPFPHLPRYSPFVVRQLVVCLLTAGVELAQPRRYERACVGEELAVNALIAHAEWEYTEFKAFLAEAGGDRQCPRARSSTLTPFSTLPSTTPTSPSSSTPASMG